MEKSVLLCAGCGDPAPKALQVNLEHNQQYWCHLKCRDRFYKDDLKKKLADIRDEIDLYLKRVK